MTEHDVIADLIAGAEDVDRMVAGLTDEQWALPTPAEGRTVAHQVGRLAFVFRIAGPAADPQAFTALTRRIGTGFGAVDRVVDADALGVQRQHTDRIKRVVGPSGAQWTFGPADATQSITGSAVDLCLLATRRRHSGLGLVATGADAHTWLGLAQACRGPAGQGRAPGQFAKSTLPA